jgi:iron(III) transport system substrate-binding protein
MFRKRSTVVFVLLMIAVLTMNVVAYAGNFDEWAKAAQLGAYASKEEDWHAVYEAAKKEGKVVIYSSSSRIFDAAQSFEKVYPGITVEAYNISDTECLEKIEREADSGIYNADLLMASCLSAHAEDLLERRVIVNYVPPEMKAVIPEVFREPVLAHRLGTVVLAYSDIAYDKPPIQSIWDLTKPEWKNGLIIRDPLRSQGSLLWLAMFVRHADEVASDYERVFGEPIELTTPNAGYELIKRLLSNGLQLQPASRAVLDGVTQHNLKRPPVGQTTSDKYRDVIAGDYQFAILWDLTPRVGCVYTDTLVVAGYAPHPNAAKLLLNWLMGGGDKERIGFEPWNVPGNFSVRTDMKPPAPFKPIAEYNYWYEDKEAYDLCPDVLDFWLTHL